MLYVTTPLRRTLATPATMRPRRHSRQKNFLLFKFKEVQLHDKVSALIKHNQNGLMFTKAFIGMYVFPNSPSQKGFEVVWMINELKDVNLFKFLSVSKCSGVEQCICFCRILVHMDDNIIRHYSNEDTFQISIEESGGMYKLTLTEI